MSNPRSIFAKLSAAVAIVLAIGTAVVAKKHSDGAFSHIDISNFGQMDEHFYRGTRPKEKDFAALKALGIKMVIDLTDNTPKEKGYVEAQGMRYVNIAIPDKEDPTDAQIAEFLKEIGRASCRERV